MTKLIAELEKFKDQLPNYGDLLVKAIFRKEKDREFVLKSLIKYLQKNPNVKVLDLKEILSKINPPELRWSLVVKFKCSACQCKTEESVNLTCFWSPGENLCCENCVDRYREDQYDALAEQEHEEELERCEQEKQDSHPSLSDLSDLKDKKHG